MTAWGRGALLALLCGAMGLARAGDGSAPAPNAPPTEAATEAAAGAEGEALPFSAGERMVAELLWSGIPVGQATFEVTEKTQWQGQPCWHLVLTARTNAFADRIYRVRDRVDSYLSLDGRRSYHYIKDQHEGKVRKYEVVTFDYTTLTASYRNFDEPGEPIAIQPDTLDPLSVFYAFRLRHRDGDERLTAWVADGLKCIEGEVRVLGRETVEHDDKSWATLHVEPELKDLGGFFQKSKKASLQVWFGDDAKRHVIKARSKVAVGHFFVRLKRVEQVETPDATAVADTEPAQPTAPAEPAEP